MTVCCCRLPVVIRCGENALAHAHTRTQKSIKSTLGLFDLFVFFKRPQKVNPLIPTLFRQKAPVRSIYFHCCSKFLCRSFTNCTWNNATLFHSIPFRSVQRYSVSVLLFVGQFSDKLKNFIGM